jgi:diaminopimelate epimerase
MGLKFEKLHGLGNDYVVVDERKNTVIAEEKKVDFARQVCQRGFSVGADGVLFAGRAEGDDVQMRIFNADGSEAESCANGLRCIAYFHHGLTNNTPGEFTIHLPLAGEVKAQVNLKKPALAEVQLQLQTPAAYSGKNTLRLENIKLTYHRIDVGNPHAVFFLEENKNLPDKLKKLPLEKIGTEIQDHPDFAASKGINAEFVHIKNDNRVTMRVHERGVGETAACGTGSIAIACACLETGRFKGWIEVHQPGGVLKIDPETSRLKGPAEHSFSGELFGPQ